MASKREFPGLDAEPVAEELHTDQLDHHELAASWLKRWIKKSGSVLPAPCPRDVRECVSWWAEHMQEPMKADEIYLGATISGEPRLTDHYALRLADTLLKFVSMGQKGRDFIVAAREDEVFWRGEAGRVFVRVYEETVKLREIGLEAYRKEAMRNARAKLGLAIPLAEAG